MCWSASRAIRGGVLEKARTAALIDEIPVLAVLGAASEGGLIVRDASELRVKETDRIATIAENFKRMGLAITVREDGFEVPGRQRFHAAEAGLVRRSSHRDGVLRGALAADGPCTVLEARTPPPCLSPNFSIHYSESRGELLGANMAVADLTLEGLVHDLNNVFQTIAESAELLEDDPKWEKLAHTLQRSAGTGASHRAQHSRNQSLGHRAGSNHRERVAILPGLSGVRQPAEDGILLRDRSRSFA